MSRWGLLFGLILGGCGRVAVYSPNDDGFARYELPESPNECTDDGDCMYNGCGNHCTSVDAESFAGSCEYAAHNDYAICGCTASVCRWILHL